MKRAYILPIGVDPTTLQLEFDVEERSITFLPNTGYCELDGTIVGHQEVPLANSSTPSTIDYESELDSFINAKAQERDWDNRITCVMRAGYPNPWQAEAIAFAQWMDSCYQKAFEIQEAVGLGQRTTPSLQEFLQEMPVFNWT